MGDSGYHEIHGWRLRCEVISAPWGVELFPATLPPWASAPISVVSLEPTRKNDAACWNWCIIKTWRDATLTHFSSHTESLFLALYTFHIYQIFVGLAIVSCTCHFCTCHFLCLEHGTHTVFTEPFLAGRFLFSGDSSDITSFERDWVGKSLWMKSAFWWLPEHTL